MKRCWVAPVSLKISTGIFSPCSVKKQTIENKWFVTLVAVSFWLSNRFAQIFQDHESIRLLGSIFLLHSSTFSHNMTMFLAIKTDMSTWQHTGIIGMKPLLPWPWFLLLIIGGECLRTSLRAFVVRHTWL